jgi:hypothetical protein
VKGDEGEGIWLMGFTYIKKKTMKPLAIALIGVGSVSKGWSWWGRSNLCIM